MATTWKTISAKISDESFSAMKLICEKEKVNPNEFIRKSVEKNLTEFFPIVGENSFEYDSESDSFSWIIKTGNDSIEIANNLGFFFIENLHKAINSAIKNRQSSFKRIGKNKIVVPHTIAKFRKI